MLIMLTQFDEQFNTEDIYITGTYMYYMVAADLIGS